MQLSDYEKKQYDEIRKWQKSEPGAARKGINFILEPVNKLLLHVVPDAALRGALNMASKAAELLTDTDDILREAGVEKVHDLKTYGLEQSDTLADSVHNWAIGIALAEGGATGFFGLPGIAADVPAIIVLALRTIHKIGLCYGCEVKTKTDRDTILAILAASGANTIEEKVAALAFLRSVGVIIAKQTWKSMASKAAETQISKEGGIIAIKTLAKQLGINLTKRKALQAIPWIGAGVGASVNGWYIQEVGWAARRVFQERWLLENGKLFDVG